MDVSIINRSERVPKNLEILRSDYAQEDLNKQYGVLSCEVEDLHWSPTKVLDEYVNQEQEFFRDDIIFVELYSKKAYHSYIRLDASTYRDYDPGSAANRSKGVYAFDAQIPVNREKYNRVNKRASRISVTIFIIVVGTFLSTIYRLMQ